MQAQVQRIAEGAQRHGVQPVAQDAGGEGDGVAVGRQRGEADGRPAEAAPVRLGQADVDIEAEGAGDLVGEILAQRLAGGLPHHAPQQPAHAQGVVAVRAAGLPPGAAALQVLLQQGRIVHGRLRQPGMDRGQAGAVAQDVAKRDAGLAVLRKARPVRRHRGVQFQLALVDQPQHAKRGQPLGAGVDRAQGVLPPCPGPAGIGPAGPQVQGQLAVHAQAEAGADLAAGLEVSVEAIADRVELGTAMAGDFHRRGLGHHDGSAEGCCRPGQSGRKAVVCTLGSSRTLPGLVARRRGMSQSGMRHVFYWRGGARRAPAVPVQRKRVAVTGTARPAREGW